MHVWITHDRARYSMTSGRPRFDEGVWVAPSCSFRAELTAGAAKELLGFDLDWNGCVLRELLLGEPPAMAGSEVIGEKSGASGERETTTEDTEDTEGVVSD